MIRAWQSGFCPEGKPVFPPAAIHPEILGDRAGWAFLWSAAFAPLALLVGIWGSPLWGMGFGAIAALAFGLFLVRIVAFRQVLPSLVEEPFAGQALPLQ